VQGFKKLYDLTPGANANVDHCHLRLIPAKARNKAIGDCARQ